MLLRVLAVALLLAAADRGVQALQQQMLDEAEHQYQTLPEHAELNEDPAAEQRQLGGDTARFVAVGSQETAMVVDPITITLACVSVVSIASSAVNYFLSLKLGKIKEAGLAKLRSIAEAVSAYTSEVSNLYTSTVGGLNDRFTELSTDLGLAVLKELDDKEVMRLSCSIAEPFYFSYPHVTLAEGEEVKLATRTTDNGDDDVASWVGHQQTTMEWGLYSIKNSWIGQRFRTKTYLKSSSATADIDPAALDAPTPELKRSTATLSLPSESSGGGVRNAMSRMFSGVTGRKGTTTAAAAGTLDGTLTAPSALLELGTEEDNTLGMAGGALKPQSPLQDNIDFINHAGDDVISPTLKKFLLRVGGACFKEVRALNAAAAAAGVVPLSPAQLVGPDKVLGAHYAAEAFAMRQEMEQAELALGATSEMRPSHKAKLRESIANLSPEARKARLIKAAAADDGAVASSAATTTTATAPAHPRSLTQGEQAFLRSLVAFSRKALAHMLQRDYDAVTGLGAGVAGNDAARPERLVLGAISPFLGSMSSIVASVPADEQAAADAQASAAETKDALQLLIEKTTSSSTATAGAGAAGAAIAPVPRVHRPDSLESIQMARYLLSTNLNSLTKATSARATSLTTDGMTLATTNALNKDSGLGELGKGSYESGAGAAGEMMKKDEADDGSTAKKLADLPGINENRAKALADAGQAISSVAPLVTASASALYQIGKIVSQLQEWGTLTFDNAKSSGLAMEKAAADRTKALYSTCRLFQVLQAELEQLLSVSPTSSEVQNADITGVLGLAHLRLSREAKRRLAVTFFARMCRILRPLKNRIGSLFRAEGKGLCRSDPFLKRAEGKSPDLPAGPLATTAAASLAAGSAGTTTGSSSSSASFFPTIDTCYSRRRSSSYDIYDVQLTTAAGAATFEKWGYERLQTFDPSSSSSSTDGGSSTSERDRFKGELNAWILSGGDTGVWGSTFKLPGGLGGYSDVFQASSATYSRVLMVLRCHRIHEILNINGAAAKSASTPAALSKTSSMASLSSTSSTGSSGSASASAAFDPSEVPREIRMHMITLKRPITELTILAWERAASPYANVPHAGAKLVAPYLWVKRRLVLPAFGSSSGSSRQGSGPSLSIVAAVEDATSEDAVCGDTCKLKEEGLWLGHKPTPKQGVKH